MRQIIVVGIVGILGLLLHIVSKSIFLSLPANSDCSWAFALCSLVGLGLILLTIPLLRPRAQKC